MAEDCNKGLALESADPKLYANRALAYFHLKKYEEALSDILKAREMGYPIEDSDIETLRKKVRQKNTTTP